MTDPLPHLEQIFPNLASLGYVHTSQADAGYNCVAWAAGDTTRNWDGTRTGGYWPPGAEPGESIGQLIQAFQSLGYERCADDSLEAGWVKIALYADQDGDWQHAARQLPDGQWTSKLGELEDITHSSLDAFAAVYGQVACFLRRRA